MPSGSRLVTSNVSVGFVDPIHYRALGDITQVDLSRARVVLKAALALDGCLALAA